MDIDSDNRQGHTAVASVPDAVVADVLAPVDRGGKRWLDLHRRRPSSGRACRRGSRERQDSGEAEADSERPARAIVNMVGRAAVRVILRFMSVSSGKVALRSAC